MRPLFRTGPVRFFGRPRLVFRMSTRPEKRMGKRVRADAPLARRTRMHVTGLDELAERFSRGRAAAAHAFRERRKRHYGPAVLEAGDLGELSVSHHCGEAEPPVIPHSQGKSNEPFFIVRHAPE